MTPIQAILESATTSLGFFWKAGWAFVLGYGISAMIQAFVPRARLARHLGSPDARSVALATLFGGASSSCSFAALSAARALVVKGAHFVAAVAFMFASTNLVVELGILIFIFLGWPFVAAELLGGLVMIVISTVLIRLTYPRAWMEAAREKVQDSAPPQEEDFDWKARIRSAEGWRLVGRRFVGEWAMVWEEIAIGFAVAGGMAVLIPESWWEAIFLLDLRGSVPDLLLYLENALVAPLVAAATFIGSMGNIPLATVLHANGVMFAGIMGFIYSDLMVPPLVAINIRYYGWRVALYIAAVMYASAVATALVMQVGFSAMGIVPESQRAVHDITRFALDYTFWLNLVMVVVAAVLVGLARAGNHAGDGGSHDHEHDHDHDPQGGLGVKRWVAVACVAVILLGAAANALT